MEVAFEWQHRLDGYCYQCALMRCDASPGQHPHEPQPTDAYTAVINERRSLPAKPDDLDELRSRLNPRV